MVAVPASMIGAVAFDRPLPAALADAFAACATARRQAVRAAARPAAAERGDVRARALLDAGRPPGPATNPSRWSAASPARPARWTGLGRGGGPERWLESLARLRPDLELDSGGALLSTWSDDPWAGAAYSTSPPLGLPERRERPVGPLAFAGEHLGGAFAALMEGAIRSGRAAARSCSGLPERRWRTRTRA